MKIVYTYNQHKVSEGWLTMGLNSFDFVVKNDDGTLAIIDIKNKRNFSVEDARKLRRNIMVHDMMRSKYFVLISQDQGYLWDNEKSAGIWDMPFISFSMNEVISRYYKSIGLDETRLRRNELELIVAQWIYDLVRLGEGRSFTTEPEKTLAEGGFIDIIQGANVHSEVQA